jgi:amidase
MSKNFDPDFGSALEAAAAIRERKISSVELTRHMFRRIDACQPKLNAYAYQMPEEALAQAKQADEAVAHNQATGALHGVPINVKESFGVQGRPCTWGVPALKDMKAERHSVPVRRLLDAGAILLGATNVPLNLTDHQSFNDIYGRTNNPWDLERSPGGSSGGSAASLAAGMAFFSIGSDIGGSIRVPAAFCGIYGHKPTLDLMNMSGHLPGGMHQSSGFSTLLAVGGPMARSAEDLEAGLRVLAGTELPDSKAFQWSLGKPRHQSLSDYRIGYVLEDPAVPVSTVVKSVAESAVRALEKAGAKVRQGWPQGFAFTELIETYLFMLGAFDFSMSPPERQKVAREQMQGRTDPMSRGALSSFAEWQQRNLKRVAHRGVWEKFFGEVDVFLMPTTTMTAYPHDTRPIEARMIPSPEGGTLPRWIC